jgi:hypothetical protein
VLHPRVTKRDAVRVDVIREMLCQNGPDAVAWRGRQLRLMGDLSQYMKLLKQRFSICYNRTHDRFGTLWAERYKSVLTEHQDRDEASLCTAIYIDLNAVRAGIVRDPKDYRYCGYGAAVGGDERARRGIMILTKTTTWEQAQAIYRKMLFAAAAGLTRKGCAVSQEDFERVLTQKGTLLLSTTLLCRMRYLTNTLVLGSQRFVDGHLETYRQKTGARMRAGPQPLPPNAVWSDLFALRTPKLRS